MNKILPIDVTQLISELAMLLESGISTAQALKIVQQGQEKPAMHKLIGAIQTDIENGMSLAESWSKYPQYFEPFLTERLRQNENQTITLAQIADYRETMDESEMDLIQEMGYPFGYLIIVTVAVLIVSTILLNFVIPVFADMFKSSGSELPAQTLFFIKLSDLLIANWWLILGGALSLGLLLWIKWQSVKLYIPLFGRFYQKIALVRCLRTCAFMLSHKVPLDKAFEAAAQSVNNSVYAKLLKQVSEQITTGTRLPNALEKHSIFPKT
jgi:type IV pilus assembly protein PilC